MDFDVTGKYDKTFIQENMMGPNSIIILEELTGKIPLKKGMRVLDLGCGNGLTSIFLAKEYGVKVFALDLWISATDNYSRFRELGLEDLIVPIHADAHSMPFSDKYFDVVISVDAYHYFGNNDTFFNEKIQPLLKSNGIFAGRRKALELFRRPAEPCARIRGRRALLCGYVGTAGDQPPSASSSWRAS